MSAVIKVLLIEDNRIEARQTQHWLGESQDGAFEVEAVEQLKLCAERLAKGGIDIVLLDLNLPDSRGLDTFNRLHEQFPDIPAVVLTGEYDDRIGPSAVEKGAQDYMVKQQSDAASLDRVLRFALARHRSQAELLKKSRSDKTARVLGFIGAKGGVGTSTIALNVAVAPRQDPSSVRHRQLEDPKGYQPGRQSRRGRGHPRGGTDFQNEGR